MSENNVYDLVIIGSGPGGLSAGIYAQRASLKTVLVERGGPGGQVVLTDEVENYPGFERISGAELVANMTKQIEAFGAELKTSAEAVGLARRDDGVVEVWLADKAIELGRAVILAPGSDYRKLGVPGEQELTGSGVSYCGTCDAPFFKDKQVLAVGGLYAFGICPFELFQGHRDFDRLSQRKPRNRHLYFLVQGFLQRFISKECIVHIIQ